MRTALAGLAYAVALAFGLYQTFSPTIDSRFARVQTERGDGMLNHFILEHSWQALTRADYRGSLFSPVCMFPEKWTLWYSEHLLGVAPLYWGLRLVLEYDLAYQWWQIILAALNFAAFALAARRLGCPHILAIAGGYLWAFGLVHIDQIKHQQMIPRFWMPLAVYYAWSFALAPSARALNRILAFTFLQSITCVYTGWFLVVGLAVFLPAAIVLRPGGCRETWRFVRGEWRRVTAIVVGWILLHLAAFVPYIVVNSDIIRVYEDCAGLVPTPSAWITGPPGTVWQETTRDWREPVKDECWLFCGFGIYLLMAAAFAHVLVRRGRDRPTEYPLVAAGIITAGAWVILTLTLREEGRSLWELVRFVPGATALRCVSRVYVVVYLFGTLAALIWLARVSAPLRPRWRSILLALVAGVLIYEQTGYTPPSFEKPDFYSIVDRTAERLQGAEAAYIHPAFTDTKGHTSVDVYGEVFAMWVGLRANVPVVNGYSGRLPPGPYPWGSSVSDDSLRNWLSGRFRGRLSIVRPDDPTPPRVLVVGE
jgi:hypothetical protein